MDIQKTKLFRVFEFSKGETLDFQRLGIGLEMRSKRNKLMVESPVT